MLRLVFAVAAFLAVAGSASAQTQEVVNPVTPVPVIEPLILGQVTGNTSHTVTVRTLDAEEMAFEIDSRTVMPRELAYGDRVRIEFRLMDSGHHHAQRITPIRPGTADWDLVSARFSEMEATGAEGGSLTPQAYALAAPEPTPGSGSAGQQQTETGQVMQTEAAQTEGAQPTQTETTPYGATGEETSQELPATASPLVAMLALGLVLVVTAGGLWVLRRRWAV